MNESLKSDGQSKEILTNVVERIEANAFPLPDRADTFARPLTDADEAELAERRKFAEGQAEESTYELGKLREIEGVPSSDTWTEMYGSITKWRSNLDAARLGKGIVQGKDRITTPITDKSPNRDRIGDLGRLRAGSSWSDDEQAWVGGEPTPASSVVAAAGERAHARFETEGVAGDRLQNTVRLPDGRLINGNEIIKGAAAKQLVLELKQGVEDRRLDVSQFETGGDMIFMVTASEENRNLIFQAAMDELEKLSHQPNEWNQEAFANIAYLLFQSPQFKKGSDAVIRTFLVTAGAYLGEVPKIPQDIDLRAGTMTQDDFIQYVIGFRH